MSEQFDPRNDKDFQGVVLPRRTIFVNSFILHYSDEVEYLNVISRVCLFFLIPLVWSQANKPFVRHVVYPVVFGLPWWLRNIVPSKLIDQCCTIASMLSIIPAYGLLIKALKIPFFRSHLMKIGAILICFIAACAFMFLAMTDAKIYAIQMSVLIMKPEAAFNFIYWSYLIGSELHLLQKAIVVIVGCILIPLSNHYFIFLLILVLRLVFVPVRK